MKVALTGGGTAGHVYPALAIGRELAKDPANTLIYVGTRGRSEELVLSREHQVSGEGRIPLHFAMSTGYPGTQPLALARFLVILGIGVIQALWHLLRFRPQLLVACGGYASAPAVFAAALLRTTRILPIRILLHEQNAAPGLMNRVSARLADVTALTFPGSNKGLKARQCCITGYPVRTDLRTLPGRDEARRRLGLQPDGVVLLAFGGSQGARSLNRVLYELLPGLLEQGVQVLHAYGTSRGGWDAAAENRDARENLERELGPEKAARYHGAPFLFDMQAAYAAADLCLARAGAGTIYELLAAGVPAVLVPKMGLPGDHQVMNARRIESTGAARIVLERPVIHEGRIEAGVDAAHMSSVLNSLLGSGEERERLRRVASHEARQDALAELLRLCRELVSQGRCTCEPAPVPPKGPASLESRSTTALSARLATTPEERNYLVYRAGAALISPAWLERNAGVKLAGELREPSLVPILLHLLNRPGHLRGLRRLFGETHIQNGFVRRNTATALGQIGVGHTGGDPDPRDPAQGPLLGGACRSPGGPAPAADPGPGPRLHHGPGPPPGPAGQFRGDDRRLLVPGTAGGTGPLEGIRTAAAAAAQQPCARADHRRAP
jgi:UDP-N-acetylglucosamine--N-acetylmuramyl-(pentapeptide) pyrophosphoryl-undecaprenol N-acetylglucosamine transferase